MTSIVPVLPQQGHKCVVYNPLGPENTYPFHFLEKNLESYRLFISYKTIEFKVTKILREADRDGFYGTIPHRPFSSHVNSISRSKIIKFLHKIWTSFMIFVRFC